MAKGLKLSAEERQTSGYEASSLKTKIRGGGKSTVPRNELNLLENLYYHYIRRSLNKLPLTWLTQSAANVKTMASVPAFLRLFELVRFGWMNGWEQSCHFGCGGTM